MLVGYARVSTQDQNPALQLDALKAVGCERVFIEKASGAQRNRPELIAALDYIREGDGLVVWKLDRLARSLPQLIETVAMLEQRGVGLRSLTESIDTDVVGEGDAKQFGTGLQKAQFIDLQVVLITSTSIGVWILIELFHDVSLRRKEPRDCSLGSESDH